MQTGGPQDLSPSYPPSSNLTTVNSHPNQHLPGYRPQPTHSTNSSNTYHPPNNNNPQQPPPNLSTSPANSLSCSRSHWSSPPETQQQTCSMPQRPAPRTRVHAAPYPPVHHSTQDNMTSRGMGAKDYQKSLLTPGLGQPRQTFPRSRYLQPNNGRPPHMKQATPMFPPSSPVQQLQQIDLSPYTNMQTQMDSTRSKPNLPGASKNHRPPMTRDTGKPGPVNPPVGHVQPHMNPTLMSQPPCTISTHLPRHPGPINHGPVPRHPKPINHGPDGIRTDIQISQPSKPVSPPVHHPYRGIPLPTLSPSLNPQPSKPVSPPVQHPDRVILPTLSPSQFQVGKKRKPLADCIADIKDKFSAENISLKCPITSKRMVIAARGKDCTHLQCFDFKTYLQKNCDHATWQCPVCGAITRYQDLEIDTYICYILILLQETGEAIEEVKFDHNVKWVPVLKPAQMEDQAAPLPTSKRDECVTFRPSSPPALMSAASPRPSSPPALMSAASPRPSSPPALRSAASPSPSSPLALMSAATPQHHDEPDDPPSSYEVICSPITSVGSPWPSRSMSPSPDSPTTAQIAAKTPSPRTPATNSLPVDDVFTQDQLAQLCRIISTNEPVTIMDAAGNDIPDNAPAAKDLSAASLHGPNDPTSPQDGSPPCPAPPHMTSPCSAATTLLLTVTVNSQQAPTKQPSSPIPSTSTATSNVSSRDDSNKPVGDEFMNEDMDTSDLDQAHGDASDLDQARGDVHDENMDASDLDQAHGDVQDENMDASDLDQAHGDVQDENMDASDLDQAHGDVQDENMDDLSPDLHQFLNEAINASGTQLPNVVDMLCMLHNAGEIIDPQDNPEPSQSNPESDPHSDAESDPHSNPPSGFPCSICSKLCKTKAGLTSHLKACKKKRS